MTSTQRAHQKLTIYYACQNGCVKLYTGGGGRPKIQNSCGHYLCAALIAIFAIDWSAKQRAKYFMNNEWRSMSFELDLVLGCEPVICQQRLINARKSI